MSLRAVVYCRSATHLQHDGGASIRSQESACRAFAEANGWRVEAVYIEAGVSAMAGLATRSGLADAVDSLAKGDVLVVDDAARLARRVELVAEITREIFRRGASVGVVRDGGRVAPRGES